MNVKHPAMATNSVSTALPLKPQSSTSQSSGSKGASAQTSVPPVSSPQGSVASVPITVYRELVAELQLTQQRLREVSDRNEHLAEQNQQLRHEIEQMILSALNLRQVANDIQPEAPILPELGWQAASQDTSDEKTQAGADAGDRPEGYSAPPSTPTELDHLLAAAIARQLPKGQPRGANAMSHIRQNTSTDAQGTSVSIETPNKTVTLRVPPQPQTVTSSQATPSTVARAGSDRPSRSAAFGGWWITILVVFVVVSAFGAGFMAMLLVQSQRSAGSSQ